MARAAVAGAVAGAAPVEVRVVWDAPWSPAMIDGIAARAAGLQVS
jgi:metal-sulfur cluster biosynthetic enzyme